LDIAVTLYVGTFGTLRTATWLLLFGAGAVLQILGLGILNWILHEDLRAASVGWLPLALLLLGLDVLVMLCTTWRKRSSLHLAMFLGAVVAATIAADVILTLIFSPLPAPRSEQDLDFPILPAWHELPHYALLRAVPNKALGFFVWCASLLIPMIWPWVRADQLRIGRTRWVWRLLCVIFAATWIGLGYL